MDSFEPKIIGFLCNWCSYAGADMTGTARIPYPANIRIVRVPCSGRVDPLFVLKAFLDGADGVLVSGCHPGDCHYGDGNYHARRRLALMHRLLDFVGVEAGRLRIDWVSAAEGNRFAQVVAELTEQVQQLGPLNHGWSASTAAGLPAELRAAVAALQAEPTTSASALRAETSGDDIQQGIRIRARELLNLGEVGCVIGYERGTKQPAAMRSAPGWERARPAFVYDPADVDRLVWDETCTHNLVTYLRREEGSIPGEPPPRRVALVAKPCDVRALNVLIQEGQVARDQVFVIGVACPGTTGDQGPQEHCRRCKERVPVFYDALVGKPPKVEVEVDTWDDVAELEALSPAERLAFWTREFDRCIRCYACRQACPGCYCTECVAEQVDPPWLSIAHGVPQKAFFHVMRAYHLAGRCVECHACDQACPMHIPLSLLNRKIAREVKVLFDSVAGGDSQAVPPLATFRRDEVWPL